MARRRPKLDAPKTEWVAADVQDADLKELFRGVDAVVHLAWLIQPARDQALLWRVNVEGSSRVFAAAAAAEVSTLVYASSVGAYSFGPKDGRVPKTWPTQGVSSSFYAQQKAEVERRLNHFERDYPRVRVVRLRPAFIFKREAATGVRRLFAGPLLPSALVAPSRIQFVPDVQRLSFQGVHAMDVADAYRRAILTEVRGAFNIAAEPVLDPVALSWILGARRIRMSPRFARAAIQLSYWLHLHPCEPGWLDLALGVPLMDTARARSELGSEAKHEAGAALRELFEGIADGAGAPTPPLHPATSGPLRAREFLTGIGRKGGV